MDSNIPNGSPPFIGNRTLTEYVKRVMTSVQGCQKVSAELQGWHHYRDYAGVHRTMEQVNASITSLISNIFSHQDIKLGLSHHKLLDQFDMIREGNDALLERINSDIDEASGLKKNADAEVQDPVVKKVQGPSMNSAVGKNVVLLASRNVQKPQLFFTEKIDNSFKEPFIPMITEKPNSIKPLSILICLDNSGREYYSHPYEYELHHWNPDPSQLTPVVPTPPKPIGDTSLVMVDTEHDLQNLVAELGKYKEIAVDVEHHGFRSYLGLTCLIQISTRDKDYIVDPLLLRGKLTILNEVFTNPKITKVVHGADYDILWLQRDCGIYVVNLFDTHQAAVVLEYPHRSLAALLSRFCQIQANKVYQRADWRIRPLPNDFIEYARQDSHYLLYIYDIMRNELIERGNQLNNLISAVYSRSAEICMKRYEKPIVGPDSHMDLYRRSRKTFNSRQMFALRELYLWRDRVAREQDESPEFVLPKHMLLQITEVLPKEMQGVLACCNPIPPLVKTELLTLHTIIREAREQPLIDIKLNPLQEHLPVGVMPSSEDLHMNFICKHDLSHCEENPTDLPTLLNPRETLLGDLFLQNIVDISLKDQSQLFGHIKIEKWHKGQEYSEMTDKFMSPYERYTSYVEMKPLLDGEKKKKEGELTDLDRVNRVRQHFLSLSDNTEVTTKENIRVATNHTVDGETQVVAEGSLLQFSEDSSQQHQQLDETDKAESEQQSETVNKTKKHSGPSKSVILSEEIRESKTKNKSIKRKSSEKYEKSTKKVKKTDEGEEVVECSGLEEGEVDESTGPDENNGNEQNPEEAFDYEIADYTIFQKPHNKGYSKRRQIKERFKGKSHKGRGGKSSMKSFTWGGSDSHRGSR
ncbi:exosome component 10-like [Homarus americanus]|uniref:Exosome complex component 10 homolog n=1 Tax=Homarus americanus TaxID=6706 RepID=A0A8J5N3K8_HOMAM|nr:exosome component 10-like [Homarus americanus]KAG7172527.1 Exosome component 10-like [Homarus americanus]